MPFTDLNSKNPSVFEFPGSDIIIIGAGTAGIVLAVSLSQAGKKVVLIESGHFSEDEEKQKLNEVQQTGKILKNAVWGRKRAVGGTTISWGGQSLPFTPIDFEERDWVQNSGWPITYAEIAPFYKAADEFMDIDTLNYSTDIFPRIKINNPGIDPSIIDFHVAKWTNNKNFYLHHKQYLEDNVQVIYNAQLTRICKNSENSIESIIVSNFNNNRFQLPVKKLIIAAGTIESVRILLTNDLGNDSEMVGKYFMDHPCIEVGTVSTDKNYRLQKNFNTHIYKGRKYSIRFSLGQEFQVRKQLLNCSAAIMFKPPKGAVDIFAQLKNLRKDPKGKHLLLILRSFKTIIKSLSAYILHRFIYKPGAAAKLSLMTEQEPDDDSYIDLSSETDQFGIPLASIHWTITPKTWGTVIATAAAMKTEIEKTGFGKVELFSHVTDQNPQWISYLSDVCHNMGGCRMSTVASKGVVDKHLKVWNTENLYICSQAVFPTGSHSNPVLTMLALALRLTNHLVISKEQDKIQRKYSNIPG